MEQEKHGFFKVVKMRLAGAWLCLTRKAFMVTADNGKDGATLVAYCRPTDSCVDAAFRFSAHNMAIVAMGKVVEAAEEDVLSEAREILGKKP